MAKKTTGANTSGASTPAARSTSVTPTPPVTGPSNSTNGATEGTTGGSAGAPTVSAATGPSPLQVGTRFVKQYYKTLSTTPDQIFRFYQASSVLSVGVGSAPTSPNPFDSLSSSDLKDRFQPPDSNCSIRFEFEHGAIDAQQSINNGILLVVTGHTVYVTKPDEESNEEAVIAKKAFVHTFFLCSIMAGSKVSYYVHNDVLRFLHPSGIADATVASSTATETATAAETADTAVTTPPPAPAAEEGVVESSGEKKEETVSAVDPTESKTKEPTPAAAVVAAGETKEPEKDVAVAVTVADEAPGGGVEESKEVMLEEADEAPLNEQGELINNKKIEEESGKVTKTSVAKPTDGNKEINSEEPDKKKDLSSVSKPLEEKKVTTETTNNAKSAAVPKSSWASLVAKSATGASTQPAPPSTPSRSGTAAPAGTKSSPKSAATAAPSSAVKLVKSASATTDSEQSAGAPEEVAAKPETENSASAAIEKNAEKASVESHPAPVTSTAKEQQHKQSPPHHHAPTSTKPEKLVGNDTYRRDPDSTLVIRNIPFEAVDKDIMNLFEKFATDINGRVIRCTVNADRGIAFMDYDSPTPVLNAIAIHKDKPFYLMDRKLHIYQKVVVNPGGQGGQHHQQSKGGNRGKNNGIDGDGGRGFRRPQKEGGRGGPSGGSGGRGGRGGGR